MRNTLESYKVAFADKLQQDITGKGIIYKNTDGKYIASLNNGKVVTASRLKKLAEKINHFSEVPKVSIPNYNSLLHQERPRFY